MADYSELLARLQDEHVAASRTEAVEAIKALQREVLAAEARGFERAAKLCRDGADKAASQGRGYFIAQEIDVAIRALITDEMKAALEQEQGNG